jgi:hypothetical protein
VTPSTVRDGLKAAVNISGLRVYDTIPEGLVPPALVVGQISIEWDTVFARGLDTGTVDLILIAGRASDRAAQDLLDGYLAGSGASSIKTKLDAARTLPVSGTASVSTSNCTSAVPVSVSVSGVDMLAYRFTVSLYG